MQQSSNPTPNIVVVIIDDLPFLSQWSESAPEGTDLLDFTVTYDSYPTTHIDAFRAESIIFPHSFCGGPKCAPSRVSILTGRYPSRMEWVVAQTLRSPGALEEGPDVTVINSKLSGYDSTHNLPTTLQQRGYHTGMVGKWHIMPGDDNGRNYGCDSLESTPNAELYAQCTEIVQSQGFDFVDAWYYGNIVSSEHFSHNPEWMAAQSQKFIDEAISLSKPFFLYFASTLVHSPDVYEALQLHSASESSKGTLTGDDVPNTSLIGMPSRDEIWNEARLQEGSLVQKTKYASYLWLDAMFGALIAFLKDKGLYDDTMLILQSDHGEYGKGLLYQQGTRIVNFIKYPSSFGYPTDAMTVMPSEMVVSNVDLTAVFFEMVNVSKSDEYVLDGTSWLDEADAVIMNSLNGSESTNWNFSCCSHRMIDIFNSHSIVTPRYQYIWRANGDVDTAKGVDELYPHTHDLEQLYDLDADPNQKSNLMAMVNHSAVISEFQRMMRDYVDEICAPELGECRKPSLSFCAYVDSLTFSWKIRSRKLTDAIRLEKLELAKAYVERDLPNCSSNASELDFWYKFTFTRPNLGLDVEVCCGDAGAVFGADYSPADGYESAREFADAYSVGAEGGDEAAEVDVIKVAIVAGIAVIVLSFACAVFAVAYRGLRRKQNKAREVAQLEVTVDYIQSHVDMASVVSARAPIDGIDGIEEEQPTAEALKTPIKTPTPKSHEFEINCHRRDDAAQSQSL